MRLLAGIPNLPDPRTPVGKRRAARTWSSGPSGRSPEFDFTPKPHWDLGPALGIIDFEQGVKITGSRFYVLSGAGARLQRALIAWMLDLHIRQGYTEKYTPFMVKGADAVRRRAAAQVRRQPVQDHEEDLWMVPTAEVPADRPAHGRYPGGSQPAAALHRLHPLLPPREDERRARCARHQARPPVRQGGDVHLLQAGRIGRRSSRRCWRTPSRPAPSWASPTASSSCAPATWASRSAITYDLEVWAPGCGEWLEVSSVSNVTDFQARRANIKYRPADGGQDPPGPHPERLGPGHAAHPDRRAGELPAGRWLGRRARGAAPVDGRDRYNSPGLIFVSNSVYFGELQ